MKIIIPYNRERAVSYAKKYAYVRDKNYFDFTNFGGNCTAYVSQCLYFANQIMNPMPIFGWYYYSAYNRSPSWSGVNYFYNFTTTNKSRGPFGKVCKKDEVEIGDIVQLKFKEFDTFTHTAIITKVVKTSNNTTVFVSSNTYDVYNKNVETYPYQKIRYIKIEGVYD